MLPPLGSSAVSVLPARGVVGQHSGNFIGAMGPDPFGLPSKHNCSSMICGGNMFYVQILRVGK